MTEFAIMIIIAACAGVAFGYAFFTALRINCDLYLQGGSVGLAIFMHVVRLGAVGGLFYISAQFGVATVLAALAGFLLARAVTLRNHKEAT